MRFYDLKVMFIMGAVGLFLAFGAMLAHASQIIEVDFTATILFGSNPPTNPVTGTIIYEAASTTANIVSLTSINLTIDGHAYSLGEIGFASPYNTAYQLIGGTVNGIDTITIANTNSNDFYILWVKDTLVPYQFAYSSALKPGFGNIWSTNFSSLSSFSVAPVPEPTTMLLLGLGLIGLTAMRRKFKK